MMMDKELTHPVSEAKSPHSRPEVQMKTKPKSKAGDTARFRIYFDSFGRRDSTPHGDRIIDVRFADYAALGRGGVSRRF